MDDAALDHPEESDAGLPLAAEPAPVHPAAYLLLAAFIGLVVCSNVANGVWVKWVREHPARLLALSSRVRYLLFARVEGVGAIPYFVIGAVRIAAAAFVCYGIGRVFEERAVTWFRRFLGMTQESLDKMRDGFGTASWLLIPFFVGSNIICVLAGLTRTRMKHFVPLLTLGIAGRLVLYWFLAEPLEKPLKSFIDFTQRHQMKFILGSVALVVLVNARNLRRGRF